MLPDFIGLYMLYFVRLIILYYFDVVCKVL